MRTFSRSEFVRAALLGGGAAVAGVLVSPWKAWAQAKGVNPKQKEKGPSLPDDLVRKFVGVSHSDLDAVKSLLQEEPALINASWDWGGGDWETGLGAAAHMGRADIAEWLIGEGARIDVFAAAMLGKLDLVKAAIRAFPGTPSVPGPHGIPLLRHAKVGGERAEAVLAYLLTLQT